MTPLIFMVLGGTIAFFLGATILLATEHANFLMAVASAIARSDLNKPTWKDKAIRFIGWTLFYLGGLSVVSGIIGFVLDAFDLI